ncbi:MAG: hypothetical protein WC797_03280 [Candidatus Paceibacterota bacterium]|jgi:hypothetical protein
MCVFKPETMGAMGEPTTPSSQVVDSEIFRCAQELHRRDCTSCGGDQTLLSCLADDEHMTLEYWENLAKAKLAMTPQTTVGEETPENRAAKLHKENCNYYKCGGFGSIENCAKSGGLSADHWIQLANAQVVGHDVGASQTAAHWTQEVMEQASALPLPVLPEGRKVHEPRGPERLAEEIHKDSCLICGGNKTIDECLGPASASSIRQTAQRYWDIVLEEIVK